MDTIIQATLPILFFAWIYYILSEKSKNGVITAKSGRTYTYSISGRYLTVYLPKILPNIYLDSHHDRRILGPQKLYDLKQRLSLEGDFDAYFQLFAPQKYHTLALSILTPDVMATLVDSVTRYDVEIEQFYLKLISPRSLRHNKAGTATAISIATKITNEIDHKLQTWTKHDQALAGQARLTFRDDQAIKFTKRQSAGLTWVAIGFAALLSAPLYLASIVNWENEAAEPIVSLGLALLLFPGVPLLITRFVRKS